MPLKQQKYSCPIRRISYCEMKNYNKNRIVSAGLLLPGILSFPLTALSADTQEAATLPDVVVSETIAPGDLGADGRPETVSKTNISAPITKVTRAEIDTTNAVTTHDAIKF